MDDLTSLHPDGVFLRREAIEHGYTDRELGSARSAKVLVRIRQGAYVAASRWSRADELERHSLRAHAVLRSHNDDLVLSHTSAAVEHGLRLYRPDLTRIHVTTLGKPIARTTKDVVYHQGHCADNELTVVHGCRAVSAGRSALEAAALTDGRARLVVLDSVLHLAKETVDGLGAGHVRMGNWPGARRLQVSVRMARPGAESVGESLARYLMWSQHLPEPVLQFEVRDESGLLLGRTDFAWPEHGVLGEFDGMQKYGRLVRPGDSPANVLEREKRREDRLREQTGWLMVRVFWDQLFTPDTTGARIREQLVRGSRNVSRLR